MSPTKYQINSNCEPEHNQITNIPLEEPGEKLVGASVCVRNGCKWYTPGNPVLSNLNMTVPCGSIYGLLGSSGCGKTTLLSCILGTRKFNSGNILVFGAKPGSPGLGIPGKNIGYMPQEIGLYEDFSISETLNYFGILCGMTKNQIEARRKFVIELLQLPDNSNQVKQMSGGQKRRLSFATALIHEPELLILDEPTVGVDPILRQKIWDYLGELVAHKRTTVIITTHYINEATLADYVGIIRNGNLISEAPTQQLLSAHGTTSLEEVVLKLCRGDSSEDSALSNVEVGTSVEIEMSVASSPSYLEIPGRNTKMARILKRADTSAKDSLSRVAALTLKNFTILLRNPFFLFVCVVMTGTVIISSCCSLKGDPEHLNFGIVNLERSEPCTPSELNNDSSCVSSSLSCQYIHHFKRQNVSDLYFYGNENDALAHVHEGKLWGYLVFPEEFSTFLYIRFAMGRDVDDVTINSSTISVRLDGTSRQLALLLRKAIYEAFQDFTVGLMDNCGTERMKAMSSLIYEEPVVGKGDTSFLDFVAPGIAILFTFFFATLASAQKFIKEKKNGVLERSLVLGVSTWEILVSQGISEFLILLMETIFNLGIFVIVFDIEIQGSVTLIVVTLILMGYTGVLFGFVLGISFSEEIQAALLGMAFIFPCAYLSGIYWPVEGLPGYFQVVTRYLPCTLPVETLRSIISRGWGIDHPRVWMGEVVLLVYICVFSVLTLVLHKIIKK